jgi:flagellar biosynthesis/type III secretory pathway chaperone
MNVLEVLKKERDLLSRLLTAVTEEKRALLDENIEEINRLVRLKEELKSCIDDVENERINICGNLKLKEIISGFEGNEKEEIKEVGKYIEETVYKIQDINNTNQLLIKHSLDYTRLVINLLSPKKVTTYNPSGRVGNTSTASSILNKSV